MTADLDRQEPSSGPRPIRPADLPILAVLHAASFSPDEAWDAAALSSLLRPPIGVGWVFDTPAPGGPLGFLLVQVVADEAEVLTLCVAPQHRRIGAARALLETATRALRAAGVDRLHLEVAEDNVAARRLYDSVGFRMVARRKNYYGRPAGTLDALMMCRELAT